MAQNNNHQHSEYSQITKHIYIGTNFCCQKYFDKNLLAKGINTDISLEEMRIDTPFGVSCYLWLPVKDYYPPTYYQFLSGVTCIDNVVRNNHKVYIHCKKGHGRAPTLAVAYLISQGMGVKEAVDFIKRKRPGADPNVRQLQALEKFRNKFFKNEKNK